MIAFPAFNTLPFSPPAFPEFKMISSTDLIEGRPHVRHVSSRPRRTTTICACNLPSEREWADTYLPTLRGAVDLLSQDGSAVRSRFEGLGESGPEILQHSITLLDRRIETLAGLITLLRRARSRLCRILGQQVTDTTNGIEERAMRSVRGDAR